MGERAHGLAQHGRQVRPVAIFGVGGIVGLAGEAAVRLVAVKAEVVE